jgi:CheY-like chemotaxis protein
MARVLALTNDLLFGSRLQADLSAAGNQVELIAAPASMVERIAGQDEVDVLVVDLTDPDLDWRGPVEEVLSKGGAHTRARVLGFYAHVDTAAREEAVQAGFDLVVPRSRMAREGAVIVSDLAG